MGWGSWALRLGGYALAPWTGGASALAGEAVAQGMENRGAIDDANADQQAATDRALDLQRGAQRTHQQRADTNNLFGTPYRTLGSLMGIDIQPIGPMSFDDTGTTPAKPDTLGAIGTTTLADYEARKAGAPLSPAAQAYEARKAGGGAQADARIQSQSGYATGRPTGEPGGDLIPMLDPRGQVRMIPRAKQAEAEAAGGKVVQHG
jgi:hypothetical protein